MNENEKHPVRILTDLLADLMIQVSDTDRKVREAQKSEDNWYKAYVSKSKELRETEDKLAAEIEAHQKLREKLGQYVEEQESNNTMQEGANENESNN